jgi:hypothetical protein
MPTRDEFNATVRERDKGLCVVGGGEPGTAVHHLIDRSLWSDGGYHADNGVLLCDRCHLAAERTIIPCSVLRERAGIKSRLYPDGFDDQDEYDHWGNVVEPSGVRYPGPLFNKENVQRALKEGDALRSFTWDIKYPRTLHFSYSPNVQNDDRMHKNDELFACKDVVATVKMDGECTTMTSEKVFARSVSSGPHPSRDWVHALHGRIAHDIPDKWRICGENLYAEHSIHYEHLPDYFLVFSIWDETNRCLSWKDTEEYSELLGLRTVPVFFKGLWYEQALKAAFEAYCWSENADPVEGYVVRLASDFRYESFAMSTAKYVRLNHVQTDEHWMSKPVNPNGLEK